MRSNITYVRQQLWTLFESYSFSSLSGATAEDGLPMRRLSESGYSAAMSALGTIEMIDRLFPEEEEIPKREAVHRLESSRFQDELWAEMLDAEASLPDCVTDADTAHVASLEDAPAAHDTARGDGTVRWAVFSSVLLERLDASLHLRIGEAAQRPTTAAICLSPIQPATASPTRSSPPKRRGPTRAKSPLALCTADHGTTRNAETVETAPFRTNGAAVSVVWLRERLARIAADPNSEAYRARYEEAVNRRYNARRRRAAQQREWTTRICAPPLSPLPSPTGRAESPLPRPPPPPSPSRRAMARSGMTKPSKPPNVPRTRGPPTPRRTEAVALGG